jgi:hypothetical protein
MNSVKKTKQKRKQRGNPEKPETREQPPDSEYMPHNTLEVVHETVKAANIVVHHI